MKIALVGIGPRNLILLRDLVKNYKKSNVNKLTIYVIDRYPIGGRVWVPSQSLILKMDTICQQITMYPHGQGPNLYQWIKSNAQDYLKAHNYPHSHQLLEIIPKVKGNDYVPRCLYGIYMQWFYDQLTKHLPNGLSIKLIKNYAYNIDKKPNSYIIYTGSGMGSGKKIEVNKCVFCLGQTVNHDTAQEYYLKKFSHKYNVKYSSVGYVNERNFSQFTPKTPVLIRGIGLNFFDVMNELTIGRGGKFTKSNGSLTYRPSGKEPKLIAGSRSGIPYYCKAANQKTNGKHPRPYFITKKYIDAHLNGHELTYKGFIHLLVLDMELIYYPKLISLRYPKLDPKKFKAGFMKTADHQHFIQSYNFKKADLFNLHKLLDPFDHTEITNVNNYQNHIVKFLSKMVKHFSEGNVTNPLSSAIEVIRDSRNYIRYLVNNHYFTKESYYEEFLPKFSRLNSRLILGTCVSDIKKLIALIRAKVVLIIPGQMVVKMLPPHHKIFRSRPAQFLAYSKDYPSEKFYTNEMIEARNPTPDLSLAKGTLTSTLIDKGILSELQVVLPHMKMITLDNTNVKPDTDQMIDENGKVEPNLYMWGVGTEGIHWFTPTSPHTSGHDANLFAADRISKDLLGIDHQKFNLL